MDKKIPFEINGKNINQKTNHQNKKRLHSEKINSPFSLDFIHHQKSLMQFYFLNFANSINIKVMNLKG